MYSPRALRFRRTDSICRDGEIKGNVLSKHRSLTEDLKDEPGKSEELTLSVSGLFVSDLPVRKVTPAAFGRTE